MCSMYICLVESCKQTNKKRNHSRTCTEFYFFYHPSLKTLLSAQNIKMCTDVDHNDCVLTFLFVKQTKKASINI